MNWVHALVCKVTFLNPHLQCVGTVRGVCWVIARVWRRLALPLTVRLLVWTHGVQVWVETCRVAHRLENLQRDDDDEVERS